MAPKTPGEAAYIGYWSGRDGYSPQDWGARPKGEKQAWENAALAVQKFSHETTMDIIQRNHVCAMSQHMDGACFICGSKIE